MHGGPEICSQHIRFSIERSSESSQIIRTTLTSFLNRRNFPNNGNIRMKLGIEREGLSHKMRGIHIVDLLLEAIETNS